MGTRNLTAVILNGKHVVAQYGQWDGYPSGQGVTVLNFLKKNDLEAFADKCKKLHFATADELDGKTYVDFPWMSRDLGAEILQTIMDKDISIIQDYMYFGANSLMCEWAYVIDLDNRKLEVYKGFNKEPVSENNRFKSFENDNEEYKSVSLLHVFDIDDLPSETDFIMILENNEEDM